MSILLAECQRTKTSRSRSHGGIILDLRDEMTRTKASSVLVALSQVIVLFFKIEAKINVWYHHIENYYCVERRGYLRLDEGQHKISRSYSEILIDHPRLLPLHQHQHQRPPSASLAALTSMGQS
jgi:hypothetical protein